jgi:membrane dipeptidase
MNRIGMMVDISHVSPQTMKRVLAISEAPAIFSHSSARAIDDHPRNVPDDVLQVVGEHGGVVMVNFYAAYVSARLNSWVADRGAEQARFNSPPYGGLYIGQPDRAKKAMEDWDLAHPRPSVTLAEVADHIDHIRKVAGVDHVGLGSDFDGIDIAPEGLDAVDKFPALLVELMRRGWTDGDVAKLAGGNVLRVLGEVERCADRLRATRSPSLAVLPAATH